MSGFFNLGSKSQAAASKTATANSNNNTKNNTLSKTIFDGIQQTLLKGIPTKLNNLTKTIVGVTNKKRASLVAGYTPGDMDVCCGRGKRNWNHKGNINFRNIIRSNTQRYIDAPTKNDKTLVVISIVDSIRRIGGHFLNQEKDGRWYDIGDALARDKVGHSLRDQVTALNRQEARKDTFKKERHEKLVLPSGLTTRSDSGNEQELRRSLNPSVDMIISSFERRPSFIMSSFTSHSETQKRASQLLNGSDLDGMKLTSSMRSSTMRGSSNWEFLDSLDDILDDCAPTDLIQGLEHVNQSIHMDDTPLRLSDTARTLTSFELSADDNDDIIMGLRSTI